MTGSKRKRKSAQKHNKGLPGHLEHQCTNFHGGPRVPIRDSGKTIRIVSDNGLYITKVDGCICHQRLSCDYAITRLNCGDIFVELKGGDVDHAVDQINATLQEWRANGWLSGAFSGLVVCNRYPRQDTKIQRMRNRFARDYGAALHVVRHGQEFSFDRIMAMDGPR